MLSCYEIELRFIVKIEALWTKMLCRVVSNVAVVEEQEGILFNGSLKIMMLWGISVCEIELTKVIVFLKIFILL